ncbi:hypothetical protein BBOV_II000150 [Babesia bovis T2Bo]|uniref:Uncharacterized protein n=1 Tax=Babesia bovis TaxID=5865 RepID=S6B3F7_BABBO|nr:hypothetical protein BBOV_II000150 [Babesia bovis T2Bo]EDO05976.2 hypothetical protein BBOV_II000150 [Babesia bovis T2Bo]BAN65983.1 hypothetical protein [Babesia bovis]
MPMNQDVDGQPADSLQSDEDGGSQSMGDIFMDAITAVGSTMRSTFVEANRCIKSCVYPCKQRCIKLYDDITSNFQVNGTRNWYNDEHLLRFGNDCGSSR